MPNIKIDKLFFNIGIITCILFLFSACQRKSMIGMLVLTQIKETVKKPDYNNGNFWRFQPTARIVAVNPKNPSQIAHILSKDFFSATAPDISFNGKRMLFAAQRKQGDIWQIYEMNLQSLKVNQVTKSEENCIDPTYLPSGKIVYSKLFLNEVVLKEYALVTGNIDGSETSQITFNPHTYFGNTVLKDGRIITISKQLYPNIKKGNFMVLRPDGSKEELFYAPEEGFKIHSRARELENGKIVFIETGNSKSNKSNLIAVNYKNPNHSRVNLSSEIKGEFYNVSSFKNRSVAVSFRESDNEKFALYEFDLSSKKLGKLIIKDEDYHIVDAVVIQEKIKPKNLPSDINSKVNTGLLLGQDINFTDFFTTSGQNSKKAVAMELLGIKASMGKVHVENDGSFYLKVMANTPFRIQTLDNNGTVVNGPSSWIYIRPNERRGCIGCHENREQVPKNIQPIAARKKPVVVSPYFNETTENQKH